MQKRKKHAGFIIVLSIIAVLIITVVGAAGIYSRFGGFGTGGCAKAYVITIWPIRISLDVKANGSVWIY